MIERIKGKIGDVKQSIRSYGIIGSTRLRVHEMTEKIRDTVVGPTFGIEREREVEKPEGIERVGEFGRLRGGV